VITILNKKLLFAALASLLILPPLYYTAGYLIGIGQGFYSIFLRTLGTVAAVAVGYQLFFLVQAVHPPRKTRIVGTSLDDKIPFSPRWVWVYGMLYYLFLGLPIAFIGTSGKLIVFIAGGSVILLIAIPIYILWPSESPARWRSFPCAGISARFLMAIQSLDNGRACFPSLHCALSAYSATFVPYKPAAIGIPIVVSLSCVFVKQHSVLDIPVSLALGLICSMISHLFI
jgi:hypothetical protein